MKLKTFAKNLFKGMYRSGRALTSPLNKDTGVAIDLLAGAVLTYAGAASAVNWTLGAIAAVSAAATLPTVLPSALVTVAFAAVLAPLGALCATWGLGFLSAANDKLNIVPKAKVAKFGRATRNVADTVTKPFRLVGGKLSQSFKKAHDGAAEQQVPAPLQVLQQKPKSFEA
jgi:hypothetical protein